MKRLPKGLHCVGKGIPSAAVQWIGRILGEDIA